MEEDFITAEKFAIDFLPHLLKYQTDGIVNVKLALSRTLTRAVMVTGNGVETLYDKTIITTENICSVWEL